MLSEDKEKKLIELFVVKDDFCLALYEWQSNQAAKPKASTNKPIKASGRLLAGENTQQGQRLSPII